MFSMYFGLEPPTGSLWWPLRGPLLAPHAIEDTLQEIKFPHRKFSAPKRDREIFAGELCGFQSM